MGKKAGRDRRAARQLSAAELREQGRRRQDRDTRQRLDDAQTALNRCYVTDTRHIPDAAILQARRQVTFPAAAVGLAVGRRTPGTWDDDTIVQEVEPWRPDPGDPKREESWGGAGWTAELVRMWLRDAMDTLAHCKGDGPGRTRSSMPCPVQDTMLAYGWDKARVPRQNTPAELAQLDVVLEWVRLFDLKTRKALVGVAMDLPLRKIAREIRCSHTQVAILERKAVAFLVDALNGG